MVENKHHEPVLVLFFGKAVVFSSNNGKKQTFWLVMNNFPVI